ncbi:MAG: adenosine deaminase [Gemmatimonadaceae bacterium]
MTPVSAALRKVLKRLPKAELHCHLDGSLRAWTLLELSTAKRIVLPEATPATLADWMRVDDARNLEDYLARFSVTLDVMQNAAALERIAYELVVDAAADGVQYIEVRFCPALNTREGLTAEDAVRATLKGLSRGEKESGTVARAIICALRSVHAPHSQQMAELAVAYKDRGVVAFDLAGGEAGNPASDHAGAFAYARAHDLAVTVHAGEGAGPESIREAVHICGADRIGHGTRLYEDAALLAYVRDRRIPLEICLTSNVQTRVSPTFADHPIAQYVAQGLVVTLNTDNRLMSGVSLTDEYVHCAEHLGFDLSTLCMLALASFDAAFVPYPEAQRIRANAAEQIDAIISEAIASGIGN